MRVASVTVASALHINEPAESPCDGLSSVIARQRLFSSASGFFVSIGRVVCAYYFRHAQSTLVHPTDGTMFSPPLLVPADTSGEGSSLFGTLLLRVLGVFFFLLFFFFNSK